MLIEKDTQIKQDNNIVEDDNKRYNNIYEAIEILHKEYTNNNSNKILKINNEIIDIIKNNSKYSNVKNINNNKETNIDHLKLLTTTKDLFILIKTIIFKMLINIK